MSLNSEIRNNLQTTFEQFSNEFLAIESTCKTFKELFAQLQSTDKNKTEELLLSEISFNCKNWWASKEKGIVPEEQIYSVLFEYDYDFFKRNNEARAYGIIEWQEFEIQTEDFSMGYNYDFATSFEACPGVMLRLFDPLEQLADENLPEELQEIDLTEEPGYFELINSFRYANYVCLHNVLNKFVRTEEFKRLNTKDNFMFLIGEHDFGEVTPLWIRE